MLKLPYLWFYGVKQIAMLPFVLKTVDEPMHPLYDEEIAVQTELYISDSVDLPTQGRMYNLRGQHLAVLRGVREAAYRAFGTFLVQNSEPKSFLPIEILTQYPYQRYVLILSVTRSYQLHEVFQNAPDAIWMDRGNSIFEYEGYELLLSAKHHISDSSVYLVAPDKFTLLIRCVRDTETTRFYRSRFIGLIEDAPPPFHLNAEEVIESVQQDIASRESSIPIGQLLMFPPSTETEIDETERLTSCPECKGEVRRISESYFCLQCDWDNLPLLKRRL